MIVLNNKITLRRPELSDTNDLLVVKNDIESSLLLGGYRESAYTESDITNWIKFHNTNTAECFYVIHDIELNSVIGHVGLYNIDHRVKKAEFGILIANKNCKGKGYGSMCMEQMLKIGFEELNLNRIELSLLSENHTALKLYEKYGFQHEGLLKQNQFKNGRYYDVILMAIMREDYGK